MRIMPSIAARFGVSLALFTFFTPQSLVAQTFGGVGERAQGMAGAFVAVADDASAVYWNPAGLAWPIGSTFDAQVGVGDEAAFFGVALPSLGVSYYRLPIVFASGNRQVEGSGEVQIRPPKTSNIGVTVNQTVVNGLVIGSTLRLVTGGFEHQPGRTTVNMDAGAVYSVGNFRAGLTARNLRELEFQSPSGQFATSRQVRAGVAFAPRALPSGVHGPFTVAFDVDLTKTAGIGEDFRDAAIGAERWFEAGRLGARAGVRWSTINDPNPAISGGLTIRLPHSTYVEGHLTHEQVDDDTEWGVGARFTF
jgi:hypothetical protein